MGSLEGRKGSEKGSTGAGGQYQKPGRHPGHSEVPPSSTSSWPNRFDVVETISPCKGSQHCWGTSTHQCPGRVTSNEAEGRRRGTGEGRAEKALLSPAITLSSFGLDTSKTRSSGWQEGLSHRVIRVQRAFLCSVPSLRTTLLDLGFTSYSRYPRTDVVRGRGPSRHGQRGLRTTRR